MSSTTEEDLIMKQYDVIRRQLRLSKTPCKFADKCVSDKCRFSHESNTPSNDTTELLAKQEDLLLQLDTIRRRSTTTGKKLSKPEGDFGPGEGWELCGDKPPGRHRAKNGKGNWVWHSFSSHGDIVAEELIEDIITTCPVMKNLPVGTGWIQIDDDTTWQCRYVYNKNKESHMEYWNNVPDCKAWSRSGNCMKGDSCQYKHMIINQYDEHEEENKSVGGGVSVSGVRRGREKSQTICKYWQNGRCKSGSKCLFKHEKEEEEDKKSGATFSERQTKAKKFVQEVKSNTNKNTSKWDPVLTGARTNRICKFWQNGSCKSGTNCKFSHDGKKSVQKAIDENTSTHVVLGVKGVISTNKMCKFWQNGSCKSGTNCKFSHDGKKSVQKAIDEITSTHVVLGVKGVISTNKICKFWQNGNCKSGTNCKFSHDEDDDSDYLPEKDEDGGTESDGDDQEEEGEETVALCNFFLRNGKCKNGNSCKYSHSEKRNYE